MSEALWFAQYGGDPHVLIVVNGTETLMHPEGCPVSLRFDWEDGPAPHMPVYECPAAQEAWQGTGLPEVGDGAYLVSLERTDEGTDWLLTDLRGLFGG